MSKFCFDGISTIYNTDTQYTQYITSQEEIGSEMEYDFGKTRGKWCAVINIEQGV